MWEKLPDSKVQQVEECLPECTTGSSLLENISGDGAELSAQEPYLHCSNVCA